MPVLRHTHKYEKAFLDKEKTTIVFICRLPDCSHFQRLVFIIGKENICWKCGEKHIIGVREAKMRKPTCINHTKAGRIEQAANEATSIDMDELMKKIAGVD